MGFLSATIRTHNDLHGDMSDLDWVGLVSRDMLASPWKHECITVQVHRLLVCITGPIVISKGPIQVFTGNLSFSLQKD
jgi:hypothetical protein